MPLTDLTDSLPWWTRNGAGAPGATGGPGAAPMGAGGQPGGPGGQAWLQYLSQMYGITPDQAAAMMQGGASPDGNPHGDGPPGPVSPDPRLGSSVGMNAQPPPMATNVQQPPPPSAGPPVGAGMLDQSGVQRGPMGVLRTQPGASAPVGAGLPDQSGVTRNAAGVLTPGVAPAATAPVPGPLASGGASGSAATSNPRFVTLDQGQNTDPTARNRGPQMTALNLAGLFGGRGANPANVPAANAQPVSAVRGPMAKYPGDDWDVDAQGAPVPSYGITTSNAPWNYGPRQNPAVTARMRNPRNYG